MWTTFMTSIAWRGSQVNAADGHAFSWYPLLSYGKCCVWMLICWDYLWKYEATKHAIHRDKSNQHGCRKVRKPSTPADHKEAAHSTRSSRRELLASSYQAAQMLVIVECLGLLVQFWYLYPLLWTSNLPLQPMHLLQVQWIIHDDIQCSMHLLGSFYFM